MTAHAFVSAGARIAALAAMVVAGIDVDAATVASLLTCSRATTGAADTLFTGVTVIAAFTTIGFIYLRIDAGSIA